MTRTEAYDKIDRYLRNNLNDDDYCLEPLCGTLYESWVTP